MYDLAKSARDKMKSKARMLAGAKDQKVDSSDWSPAEPLNADVKTGMRPVGKSREYKAGGVVAKARADRKPRKAGGRAVEKEIGVGMANKDMKAANEQREGKKHIGGMKKGGRTKKNIGGVMEKLSPAYGLLRAAERGGRDEERDTNEQMKGAMMANLASRKSGGGVKDKKALGGIDPSPKRGAAGHYKKGGRIKREDGGKLPDPYEAMRSEERMGRMKVEEKRKLPLPREAAESAARTGDVPEGRKAGGRKWIQKAIEKPGSLRKSLGVKEGEKIPAKKLEKAAEAPGKLGKRARLAQTLKGLKAEGGRTERKAGGRAKGKGKTHINIMINAGRKEPHMPPMPPAGGPDGGGILPVPMPPAGAMGAPGPAPMPPMGAVGGAPPAPLMGAGMPPGRKAGGRITKVASSYKDLEAGAVSGEGRLQKTDIAKKHHGAPTRKTGGRAVKSYRDMTAGSESGSGRLQKTEMEKSQRLRGH